MGHGFVDHGDEPVLQRARLEADPAVGVASQVFAAFAGGLAEGAALGQGGVQLADVLGRGDDEDAVTHAQHGRDALVDDGLGQRADGADFVVDVGGGGRFLVRLGTGLVHGGLAGVQHQHGHARVVQQLAQFVAGHGPHFLLAGRVFEQQVAVFARLPAAQRQGVDGLEPIGQAGVAQVLVHAVPVEVDDVVGPPGGLGVGQFLLQLLEGGRPQGGDVEAGEVFAQVLQQPVGHRPQFDVVSAARPADDVQQPDASLVGRRHGDEADVRIRLDPHERLHAQGDGRIGLGVAHQFPGNGRGLRDARGDFNPQVGQLFPHGEPDGLRIHVGGQDLGVQLLAPLPHPLFDLFDLHRLGRIRAQQVVFQVPAQLLLFVRR